MAFFDDFLLILAIGTLFFFQKSASKCLLKSSFETGKAYELETKIYILVINCRFDCKYYGLVTATILSCQVTNTDLQIDNVVSIIDADLTPICDLGAAITTGQGDANLEFTWSSFKWSTTKIGTSDVLENQQLTCSISLAKEPAAVSPQTCGSSGEPARGAGSFIELNEMACNVAPPPLPTELSLDECKAQCEQDSECAAYLMSDTWCSHYTECDERMPWPIPGSKLYLWRQ